MQLEPYPCGSAAGNTGGSSQHEPAWRAYARLAGGHGWKHLSTASFLPVGGNLCCLLFGRGAFERLGYPATPLLSSSSRGPLFLSTYFLLYKVDLKGFF